MLRRFCVSSGRRFAATRALATNSASCFVIPDDTLLMGCVSYDPAVGDIWTQMKQYLQNTGVDNFDFVLFTNYEQQVRALLNGHVHIAWNGPLAHVMAEHRAPIVSLGMRDVDCDFESIVVVKNSSNIQSVSDLNGKHILTGAQDSPQAHVVPLHYLTKVRNVQFAQVQALNEDLGKHGDTAKGEISALQALASKGGTTADGALVSRLMWDRAVNGQLDLDATQLQETVSVLESADIPRFDHCQFDALAAHSDKLNAFYTALHGMDYNDPQQQPIMELEGIRRSWAKPRQEGYDIVRQAMGLSTRRAQNFVPPSGTRAFSSQNNLSTNKTILEPGKHVGVIGCGVAGLQVIRSMRARGYDVTAFDKADDIGGLWRDNYANFGLQVPKQFYEMPDSEFKDAEWGEIASGEKVQAYIKQFAADFDLEKDVRLNTGIDRVVHNSDGTWTFHTDAGEQHDFDYCVVSTGMYSTIPFEPTVPGRDSFAGEAMHSSQFKDAETVAGKRVVVVGGCKSATDCATSAANAGAESVTMIQRHAHWQTPTHIAGLIPFQHVFLSRLGQALVEAKVGVYPGSKSAASMFRPMMGPIFAIVEALFAFQLGLQGDLRPKAGVVEDFYGYASVHDGTFKAVRDAGKVSVKTGEIESFTKDGVRFNGEEIAADKVIFATGFAKDYAGLLEPDVFERLDVQNDGLYLYKHILPPSVPGLAFVGSESATIFNCTSYGIQAEWLARTLAGETEVDLSEEAMARESQAFRDFARSWMPATASRSGLVLLHQLHYHDQLLEDMGENPSRKSNPVAEYLGSYYSQDYNGIVGRPSRVKAPTASPA